MYNAFQHIYSYFGIPINTIGTVMLCLDFVLHITVCELEILSTGTEAPLSSCLQAQYTVSSVRFHLSVVVIRTLSVVSNEATQDT